MSEKTHLAHAAHPELLKLGKKAPKVDARRLRFAEFLTAGIVIQPSVDWFGSVLSWGMMLNDALGDCTCAEVGHGTQVASLNSGEGEYTVPDELVLNLYEKACGYNPDDPSTDQGGVITDVLDYVRANGFGPHAIFAYSDTDPGDQDHVKLAIQTGATLDIGLQLPLSAQSQVGGLWDVVGAQNDPNNAPGSWGGHSVVVSAYDADTLTCITWGAPQKMTWAFWEKYTDESHLVLYRIWCEGRGGDGSINLKKMEQALAALNG